MSEIPSATSQFECPVCFEEFTGHIYQCHEGHPLCHECYPKFTKCPTCRQPLDGNIRNRMLEQIVSSKSNNKINSNSNSNTNSNSNSNSNTKENSCSMDDDVEFIIGKEKKSFYGMRAMFAAQSEPLKTILSKNNKIIIEDVTKTAWNYFQELVYFKKPTLTYDIVVDVFYLAQKYSIKHLMEECQNVIINVSDMPSCHFILEGFNTYSPSKFCETFFGEFIGKSKFMKTNAGKIIEDKRLNEIVSPNMFKIILKSDIIEIDEHIYSQCKEYCQLYAQNNEIVSWEHMFKLHFMEYFNFKAFSLHFILTVLRIDGILTSDNLLNVINDKYDNYEIGDVEHDGNNNNNNNEKEEKEENNDEDVDEDMDNNEYSDRSREGSSDRNGRQYCKYDKFNKGKRRDRDRNRDRDRDWGRNRDRGKYNKFNKYNKFDKHGKYNKFGKYGKHNKYNKFDKFNKFDKYNKHGKFNKYKQRSRSRSRERF